mmetsp:Transcript_7777/g.19214  ORF Transcript_7777/g.19214 Transcript_7777/m.19214 type:complete len:907 (-) Transcript_7777:109-2829(-)
MMRHAVILALNVAALAVAKQGQKDACTACSQSQTEEHVLLQRRVDRLPARRHDAESSSGPAMARTSDPLDWEAAYDWARATLAEMRTEEKHALLRGSGWYNTWELEKWWYTGNTPAIPRLSIPSLNMQDASWGFRPTWKEMVGTVTCWPSGLALGATWNPEAVRQLAVALGQEFIGKGANVILGPSVEVHRVARNGRNFEYISGEDPYLGARLTEAYVHGVQSQGVASVVKHWAFNHQETKRKSQSSNVDEKTAWELYYGPFQAAVDAGVSAAMCSYNKVNGEPACGSRKLLGDLKQRMGFRGFIQSDWWAVLGSHSTGLDQVMPGTGRVLDLNREDAQSMDEAVTRILAATHRMRLRSDCSPPNCENFLRRNVSSSEHLALGRRLAAESVVLLKNEGDVLPISSDSVATIAVIGSAAAADAFDPNSKSQGAYALAVADYYSGGGSGHCAPATRRRVVVKPLDGIKRRAASAGIRVVESPSNSVSQAISAARQSDIAIVVAATTSEEGKDRRDLHLDDGVDGLIDAVSRQAKRTVVISQIPGAVVMPWRDSVDGILAMFLGGQETGSAWADVLFGDHAPTGRLPIMIPETEADTIPPSNSQIAEYSEGMATSYRNKRFKAAFPFGHGLTYTSFEYLAPAAGLWSDDASCAPEALVCIRVQVRNIGQVAGETVAQLYLEFPSVAQHPAPMLKGFRKTGVVLPGGVVSVTFSLSRHDLSFYKAPPAPPPACCANCAGFCSPLSGNCYASRDKDYYKTCSGLDFVPQAPTPTPPPAGPETPACCSGALIGCSGFCSPQSGNCYPWKKKSYYVSCTSCCGNCQGEPFCSPQSGNCYSWKRRDYYESCSAGDSSADEILETPPVGEWIVAENFFAHIGESSADIRQSLPLNVSSGNIPTAPATSATTINTM